MFNVLRNCYSRVWVPFFGRILSKFIVLIEGEEPKEKPNFNIENPENEFEDYSE